MSFRFECRTCGDMHEGLPSFGPDAPASYVRLEDDQKHQRAVLGSDNCIIDNALFFIRARLAIPIDDHIDPFVWLVWCSLSKKAYDIWADAFDQEKRSQIGPLAGRLNTILPFYKNTLNLVTTVHLCDDGKRPFLEVQKADHQLYYDQRDGLTVEETQRLVHDLLHST